MVDITDSVGVSLNKPGEKEMGTGKPGVLQSMGSQRDGHALATEATTCTVSVSRVAQFWAQLCLPSG